MAQRRLSVIRHNVLYLYFIFLNYVIICIQSNRRLAVHSMFVVLFSYLSRGRNRGREA
ncbi:unnamed protein product, partial [Tenebrio molitor]